MPSLHSGYTSLVHRPKRLFGLLEIPRASSLKILDSKLSLRSSFVTCSTNTGASLLERSATLPDVLLPSLDMKAFTSPHSTASNKHQGYVTKVTNALVVGNSRKPEESAESHRAISARFERFGNAMATQASVRHCLGQGNSSLHWQRTPQDHR